MRSVSGRGGSVKRGLWLVKERHTLPRGAVEVIAKRRKAGIIIRNELVQRDVENKTVVLVQKSW